jgi:two-component sensor histidine kinase
VSESNICVPENRAGWLYVDEIMHRVLNDYTAMLAVVHLASRKGSDLDTDLALERVARRLNASATAFRALRPPSDHGARNLDEELEILCTALSQSILPEKSTHLALSVEPVCVPAQVCWKICMIVSELVTNAARHAFAARSDGAIAVDLSVRACAIRCAVIDDGRAETVIIPGRGTRIMDAIATELGGTIERTHTSKGSAVALCVPLGGNSFSPTRRMRVSRAAR